MPRHHTLDLLRGLVMIFMIIDHTQEYQAGPGRGLVTDPMNLAVTTGPVFFFRILSHFCAPVFTLLMGISACLSATRRSAAEATRHLLARGAILIVLEFTIVNWAWTFNPFWPRYFFQIIGALGVALICLSLAPHLSRPVNAAIGLGLVGLHNLFDGLHFAPHTFCYVAWSFLHEKNLLPLGNGFEIRTTYPVIPIIGVAFCGYALGAAWNRHLRTGLLLIGLFLLLRITNFYGDASRFEPAPYPLRSLVNVTKYPLSLQFVLMTLGPALVFLAWFRDRTIPWLEQLGRTAMFFYVAHLILLHTAALAIALLLGEPVDLTHRFGGIPNGIGFPPWATAPLALAATAVLFPLCRWYEPRRWRYL
jgi:uncharacterized membrane protein